MSKPLLTHKDIVGNWRTKRCVFCSKAFREGDEFVRRDKGHEEKALFFHAGCFKIWRLEHE